MVATIGLIASFLSALVVSWVWHVITRPALTFCEINSDSGEDSERYHLKIQNSGRTAAKGCKAELFLVVKNTTNGHTRLDRLHRTLSWLSAKQNTQIEPSQNDLIGTKTIPGKETARVYLGWADYIGVMYHYPPAIKTVSSPEQDSYISLDYSEEYQYADTYGGLLARFQNKEEYFPSGKPEVGHILNHDKSEYFDWKRATIETAEIRVTCDNAASKEISFEMGSGDKRETYGPSFQLRNRGILSRANLLWNYRLPKFIEKMKRRT